MGVLQGFCTLRSHLRALITLRNTRRLLTATYGSWITGLSGFRSIAVLVLRVFRLPLSIGLRERLEGYPGHLPCQIIAYTFAALTR